MLVFGKPFLRGSSTTKEEKNATKEEQVCCSGWSPGDRSIGSRVWYCHQEAGSTATAAATTSASGGARLHLDSGAEHD
jgi:hypothetical protein